MRCAVDTAIGGVPRGLVLASRSHTDGISISAADIVEVQQISLGPTAPRSPTSHGSLEHRLSDDEQELLDAAGGTHF
jgi:hypothetical protein